MEAMIKLRQMLDSNTAKIIAICGDWGVGKTHFWKGFAKQYYENNNIYITLIGKDNISAIKEELLLKLGKQNSCFENIKHKLKSLKLAVNLGVVSFNAPLSNLLNLTNSEDFGNNIICFDDMERMDSTILRSFLGLVNKLKEHKDCKIVLIFNQNKTNTASMIEKDKIIDESILFNPNAESCFEIAISDTKLESSIRDSIKQYCVDKNITNIRIIKIIISKLLRFSDRIKSDCDIPLEAKEVLMCFSAINAVKIGVDYCRFYKFYVGRNLDNESIVDEFSTEEIQLFDSVMPYMRNNLLHLTNSHIKNIADFINNEVK